MALTKFEKDMNIIAPLDNEPNDVGGLSAEQLKAKFDEGNKATQKYINETLTAEIDQTFAEKDVQFATKEEIQNVALGQIPDKTITDSKLHPTLSEKINSAVQPSGMVDSNVGLSPDVATALGLDPATNPQVKDALLTINALANSKAKIVTGSYTGTGTYGSDNPNRLTFGFEPYFIAFFTESGNLHKASSNETLDNGKQLAGLVTMLTTNYQVGTFPYSHYDSGGQDYYSHSKMSEDRKTLYWYSSGSAGYQYNSSGTIYYYLAIG